MFGWFKSERRERQKKVRQDRKHLEERVRRFLKSYLNADETRKPQYYRAVEDISKKCQSAEFSLSQPDMDDRGLLKLRLKQLCRWFWTALGGSVRTTKLPTSLQMPAQRWPSLTIARLAST